MATFTAASNVTGLIPPISEITNLLHSYNILSFWDYATGAPYLPLKMTLQTSAIFFSPHKMLGGINTPGVLVIKKSLVDQISPPSKRGGGGTVFYVTQQHHRFLSNRMERYEGGTPDIVGIWRIGMVFLKKREVEGAYRDIALSSKEKKITKIIPPTLWEYECQTYRNIVHRLRTNVPNLILLGTTTSAKSSNHLPIFSFLIKCSKRFLHYNYVCALLNDLFGIQSRGGCQCSGPYSQRLLGLTTSCCTSSSSSTEETEEEVPNEANVEIEAALLNHKERSELLRPGYSRLSLPFKGLATEEVEYVVKAMEWVARYGWMMMCLYRCNHRTGEWRHWSRQGKPLGRTERRWLSHYNTFTTPSTNNKPKQQSLKEQLNQTFHNANLVLEKTKSDPRFISEALSMNTEDGILGGGTTGDASDVGDRLEKLRWYVYPQECARWLKDENVGDMPPGTMDEEILGAVRPLGFSLTPPPPLPKEDEEVVDTMDIDSEEKIDQPKEETVVEDMIVEGKEVDGKSSSDGTNGSTLKRKIETSTTDGPPSKLRSSSSSKNVIPSSTGKEGMKDNETNKKEEEPKSSQDKSSIPSNHLFSFRDGEHHSGQATMEEIEGGINDGEISEKCQIYCSMDEGEEWISVGLFLEKFKVVDAAASSSGAKHDVSKNTNGVTKTKEEEKVLYSFRDGEHHSGQATLEEIEDGFNDGEISEQCEIYSVKNEEWISVEVFLKKFKDNAKKEVEVVVKSTPQKDRMEKKSTAAASTVTSLPVKVMPKVAIDSARAKKKPSRDSSTWGRSSCATYTPATQTTNNDNHGDNGKDMTGSATTTKLVEDASNQNGKMAAVPSPSKTSISPKSASPSAASKSTPPKNNRITRKKGERLKPPPKLMRYITQAMIQWSMVEEGDRLLLGLSGGKDSLSLLHCLLEFQRKLPINFEIEVCTIDPMTPSFDPSPLIPYVESLGLKYHYIRDDIVARANTAGKDGKVVSSLCSFCARMKRGNLYQCARDNNCNKLVLAQHLDDCAESFLMSVMHNGFIRTMKANYQINAGDISVIRPLVYCRESLMTDFAKSVNLPVINENCPACFEEPKERARVKKLLSREETLYPNLFDNLRRSLIPVMHDDNTSIMRSYLEDTLAKSRRTETKKNKKKKKHNKNHKDGEDGDDNAVTKEKDDSKPDEGKENNTKSDVIGGNVEGSRAKCLADASEEELIAELARRRAEKFRLSGAMKRLGNSKTGGDDEDPTGQVCTLNGGNGSIPCSELME
uniref:tRNA(Ile)-lysidine/2-thiocytidine synthase N-terminal domain-containing protein n=1 Tax=Ditylum brightwellii TaxID=49249 RepID=A0A7S4VQU2_9STRA